MADKLILLVDDDIDSSDIVKKRLEINNYKVVAAYDGQDALDKARKLKPDLIILDLMLPKLDGYKVCRMLKFDEKYKNIPIVMFTARAQDSDEKLGYEVGADAFFTKSFEPAVLLKKVEELLKE